MRMALALSSTPARNLAAAIARSPHFILIFAALTLGAIAAQTWQSIDDDRIQSLQAEHANALMAVRLLDEHATQTLHDAERKLEEVARQLAVAARNGPITAAALSAAMQENERDTRYLKAVELVLPSGETMVSSFAYPAFQADSDERSYVAHLLQHPAQRSVEVGAAFMRYYDSQLVLPLARNVHADDGRLLGVLSTDISINYFQEVYSRVGQGRPALLALLSNQGNIIVRWPFERRYVGAVATPAIRQQLQQGKREGTFDDADFLNGGDQHSHQYTYRRSSTFGLVALIARAEDTILADWRRRTREKILYAAAFSALHLLLTALLARQIGCLRRSEQELRSNIGLLRCTQRSLRSSEAKFSALFRHSPAPLALVDCATGAVIEANVSFMQQFALHAPEADDPPLQFATLWEKAADCADFLTSLSSLDSCERREARMRRADGRTLYCHVSAGSFDSDTKHLAICSLIDVTQQLNSVQHIARLNADLEERVQRRTRRLELSNQELVRANDSLQRTQHELFRAERMAALGTLVAGIAHELNTPLGNSVTLASTLVDETAQLGAELGQAKPSRQKIAGALARLDGGMALLSRNLERSANLINSFRQIAIDPASDRCYRFNLASTTQEVLATVNATCREHQCAVTLDITPEIELNSYPGALSRVLLQLVSNTLIHGLHGRAQGRILIAGRLSDGMICLQFTDDGIGIPEAHLARVCDPFFTTRLGQGSSGLGMHITYQLVTTVLRGTLEIASSPAGTMVTIVLPLDSAPGPVSTSAVPGSHGEQAPA